MSSDLSLPRIQIVSQAFARPRVADLEAAVQQELSRIGLSGRVRSGQSVAVAVGSRGIRDIDRVVRALVGELVALGARPFIVPAMGSHGGGTARGQEEVLAGLGVDEDRVGCPVRASMEVVELGRTASGIPVLFDRQAAGADHVIVVNRVKSHTKLSGDLESGLSKMCLIGLGKREGARLYHRAFERHGWMPVLTEAVALICARSPLLLGLAVVQNAHEEVAHVEALAARDFLEEEPRLLEKARGLCGHLPLLDMDLLVVDAMGKDISGTGMDTNVTGRKPGSAVRVRHLFVRDLTERTHGNAQGIGLADFTTRHLVDKIDTRALYVNSQTASRTDTCKIPMTLDSDREALQVALRMATVEDLSDYRLVWIRNTLELSRIAVSLACLTELRGRPGLSLEGGPQELRFDDTGRLISPL